MRQRLYTATSPMTTTDYFGRGPNMARCEAITAHAGYFHLPVSALRRRLEAPSVRRILLNGTKTVIFR